MTKPPCKVDGVECNKRYVGCHADCEAYHKWLEAHDAAMAKNIEQREMTRDADTHMIYRHIKARKRRSR